MNEYYIRQMTLAHNEHRWDDRSNYAKMAQVDFVKWFYFYSSDKV